MTTKFAKANFIPKPLLDAVSEKAPIQEENGLSQKLDQVMTSLNYKPLTDMVVGKEIHGYIPAN